MASRSLDDLLPAVKAKADEFCRLCREHGMEVLIYCTYRSDEEQNGLYAQGRSKPGKIVTNVRGGESWHNYRRAFDFVPLVAGKPAWDDTNLYRKAGVIAESVGLEWAGRWAGKLKETAHCQDTGGLTLAQARAGGNIV